MVNKLLTLKFGRSRKRKPIWRVATAPAGKIDPQGITAFFQWLSKKDKGRVEWLSTHPMSAGRPARLKDELAGLPKRSPEPFIFDWAKVLQPLVVQPVAQL